MTPPQFFSTFFFFCSLALFSTSCKQKTLNSNNETTELIQKQLEREKNSIGSSTVTRDFPAENIISYTGPIESRPPISQLENFIASSIESKWKPLSSAVIADAKEKNLPIFLICCDSRAVSTELIKRLFDPKASCTKRINSETIVAYADICLIDELRPDVLQHGRLNSSHFPVFVVLTPEGLPILIQNIDTDNVSDFHKSIESILNGVDLALGTAREAITNDTYAKIHERRKTFSIVPQNINSKTIRAQSLQQYNYSALYSLKNSRLDTIITYSASPFYAIESVATTAINVDSSSNLALISLETANNQLKTELLSSLIYWGNGLVPIGYYNNSNRLPCCDFPIENQQVAIKTLCLLYHLTQDLEYLALAEFLYQNIEKRFQDEQGLFVDYLISDLPYPEKTRHSLYPIEDLEKLLTPDEMDLLKKLFQVSTKGNLLDTEIPETISMNSNSLSSRSRLSAARRQELNEPNCLKRLCQISQKLSPTNFTRLNNKQTVARPSSMASQILSSLDLYAATNNHVYLSKAEKIQTSLLETFQLDGSENFRRFPKTTVPATARDLALVAIAACKLYGVNSNQTLLDLAIKIETNLTKNYSYSSSLVFDLPLTQQIIPITAFDNKLDIRIPTQQVVFQLRRILGQMTNNQDIVARSQIYEASTPAKTHSDLHLGAHVRSTLNRYHHVLILRDAPDEKWKPLLAKCQSLGIATTYASANPLSDWKALSPKLLQTNAKAYLIDSNQQARPINSLIELQNILPKLQIVN